MKIGSLFFALVALFALAAQSSAQIIPDSIGPAGVSAPYQLPPVVHPHARHGNQAQEVWSNNRPPRQPPLTESGPIRFPSWSFGPNFAPAPTPYPITFPFTGSAVQSGGAQGVYHVLPVMPAIVR